MARKLRLEFAGACYHVINRGNYRRDLFADHGAAASFEGCLAEAAFRFGWRVHAFVIMRNHFHLGVQTPEPNLSHGMQWLQGTWVSRVNRFRGQTGRPFQGRYKALHVEPGHALAQVAHYIHLNPVRAGIVPADRLLDHPWSSLTKFAARSRPGWLEPRTVLHESGGLSDTAAGWRNYLRYLGWRAEDDAAKRQEKFMRLSRGWAVGSAEFKAELAGKFSCQERSEEPFELLGADREAHRQARTEIWEAKLRRAAAALGISLERLPVEKSAREKVRLAALLKCATSTSNRWLTERLQMGRPTSVSQFVGRFRRSGGTETGEFRAALSKVVT